MSDRQIIVVDVETNGLDIDRHEAVEVSWVNLTTGDEGTFIPMHSPNDVLARAEITALQVNRYIDRIAHATKDRGKELARLAEQLEGNTLAGSNPTFDSAMLRKLFNTWAGHGSDAYVFVPAWHHRLLDLSVYAAAILGLPPNLLPGLSDVCQLLGVENEQPHTAGGDAAATAECFRRLIARAEGGDER